MSNNEKEKFDNNQPLRKGVQPETIVIRERDDFQPAMITFLYHKRKFEIWIPLNKIFGKVAKMIKKQFRLEDGIFFI
jgi:hypothetical protein